MSTFAALKKNSGTNLDDLKKKFEDNQDNGGKEDDRFWAPTVDKAGNGMATIRFLPTAPADGDLSPWVKCFRHSFEDKGGWFIDGCLTTIDEQCPVCEANKELWNTKIKANQDIVRNRKRKLFYIANVYIVSDPSAPENEGKVKLFKFGKKIFDKLKEAMNPEFPDEKPFNPFDLWAGANFKLKIRKVDDYRNYDKSGFEAPAALFDDDDMLEKIWKMEYSIQEFVDPANFKKYSQLKDRLDKVLALRRSPKEDDGDDTGYQTPLPQRQQMKTEGDTDDSDFSYFQSLAKDTPGDDVPF